MTIGEVAQIIGVATSTLRYYESIGLLPAPQRVNGRRQYSADVLPLLTMIQLAKDANFTLDEIQELIHGFPVDMPLSERWRAIAARKLREIDDAIRQAQETRALLEETLYCPYLHFELNASLLLNASERRS